MSARCLVCGSRDCVGHHPTGRGPDGGYLDRDLRLPYCHDDHTLVHDDWWTLRVQDPERGTEPAGELAFIEHVEVALRRGAATAARIADAHSEHAWIAAIARALKRWADMLRRHIEAQDRRDPGWRDDPGFYPTG
jgi:hypothetical protein